MLGQYGRIAGCAGLLCVALLAGCGSEGPGAPPPATGLSAKAQAGKALFFDKSLSASGAQSCGTCHVPSRAFTADPATDHDLPVPLGGRNMDLPGFRNAPSLLYASLTPAFSRATSQTGGFFRDGRASSLAGAGAAAVHHPVRDGQCRCRRGAGRACRPPRRRCSCSRPPSARTCWRTGRHACGHGRGDRRLREGGAGVPSLQQQVRLLAAGPGAH